MKTDWKEKQKRIWGLYKFCLLSDNNLLYDRTFSYDYQPHCLMAESVSKVIVLTELKSLEFVLLLS